VAQTIALVVCAVQLHARPAYTGRSRRKKVRHFCSAIRRSPEETSPSRSHCVSRLLRPRPKASASFLMAVDTSSVRLLYRGFRLIHKAGLNAIPPRTRLLRKIRWKQWSFASLLLLVGRMLPIRSSTESRGNLQSGPAHLSPCWSVVTFSCVVPLCICSFPLVRLRVPPATHQRDHGSRPAHSADPPW